MSGMRQDVAGLAFSPAPPKLPTIRNRPFVVGKRPWGEERAFSVTHLGIPRRCQSNPTGGHSCTCRRAHCAPPSRSSSASFPRQTESPLDQVRLNAQSGRLQASITDGSSWVRIWLACEGANLDTLLPARALLDFVSGAERDAVVE